MFQIYVQRTPIDDHVAVDTPQNEKAAKALATSLSQGPVTDVSLNHNNQELPSKYVTNWDGGSKVFDTVKEAQVFANDLDYSVNPFVSQIWE